jgi:hypothetical protein
MGPNVGLKPTRSTIRLVQPPLRNPPKQGKKAGVLAAFEDVTPHPPKRDVLHNLLPQPSKTFGPCIHYTDWAASQPVARADFLCGHLRTPQGRPRCLHHLYHHPTAPRLHLSTVAIAQTGSDGHSPSTTDLHMHRCNLAATAATCTLYSPPPRRGAEPLV